MRTAAVGAFVVRMAFSLSLVGSLFLGADHAGGEDVLLARGAVQVKFDAASRTLEVADDDLGPVLRGGVIRARVGPQAVSSDQPGLKAEVAEVQGRKELLVGLGETARLRIGIGEEGQVELRTEGPLDGPITCQATAAMGPRPVVAVLVDQKPADNKVLVTTLGPAEVPAARSLYDAQRDLAVTAEAAGSVRWQPGDGWKLVAEAPSGGLVLTLRLQRDYYRDRLKIAHYAPLGKQQRWPTAPVVAMTWYGIEGWKGRPAQRKEWLYPNVDWVAKHLLPYAGENLVFQLDDNYPLDDKIMREFSDYIRSKGLVPGIWFTPYVVAPVSEAAKHPARFLHDAAGKTIPAFGGITYGGAGQSSTAVLNVTNPEAVKARFGMWWRKASETWNYDFFKIDGQPNVVDAYRKAVDGGGIEGYRKGLEVARSIVGPEKFINGCWGIPLEAIGRVNGSRTGGDTGNDPHAIGMIVQWNFLNNVCWWCDPDAAANLYRATVERTRLNAQARVLTGQQFLTDDVWTKVPPGICRVWQLSYPTLDIRPVNLYKIDNWHDYDLMDLRVAKPWGTWDVVGLFNYDGSPVEKVLDLGRLPLAAPEVHVFEYWSSQYLGRHSRSAKIPRRMAAYEGQVFSLVPADPADANRPALVSTSRHVTQGAADVDQLAWGQENEEDKGWIAAGASSRLVAGDPYTLVFAAPRYQVASVQSSMRSKVSRTGSVHRVEMLPEKSGSGRWQVAFEPLAGPCLAVSTAAIDVPQGTSGQFEIQSFGPKGDRFRVRVSDARVKVTPPEGSLGPWPAKQTVNVSAESVKLEPGDAAELKVAVEAASNPLAREGVVVRVHAPPPENFALKAKATASSIWGDGYEASKANDGSDATRWNSREGDVGGCWLELTWPQPVEFNRVVIDECTDFGPRIQSWRLEAGTEQMGPIARGDGAGRQHLVKLPQTVKATRLRLTVERASVVPTIWELKAFRGPERN